jgi:hypothetical protein
MTLALTCAAFRCRPFSLLASALLLVILASLLDMPAPMALLVWLAASLAMLEAFHVLESFILKRLGYRPPTYAERERLEPAAGCGHIRVMVIDAPELWVGHGLRILVITCGMLDVLEDRALTGMLHNATNATWPAALAAEMLAWFGALPITVAWSLSRCVTAVARLLAVAIGRALVLPLVVWPRGFTVWGGRALAGVIVGLFGAALLSNGLAAVGLVVLLAWALVPGLQALLTWETRRAESRADDATVSAGLGWQLVEALETLQMAQPLATPPGLHGLLSPAGAPLGARADRIRRVLAAS